mmetsp:Transcript_121872/g.191274  ORF Transcript_121872/g.191274 Transcript_121872/m.191274 type:complete len:163 (+) Transcript_121872:66-554(+)
MTHSIHRLMFLAFVDFRPCLAGNMVVDRRNHDLQSMQISGFMKRQNELDACNTWALAVAQTTDLETNQQQVVSDCKLLDANSCPEFTSNSVQPSCASCCASLSMAHKDYADWCITKGLKVAPVGWVPSSALKAKEVTVTHRKNTAQFSAQAKATWFARRERP